MEYTENLRHTQSELQDAESRQHLRRQHIKLKNGENMQYETMQSDEQQPTSEGRYLLFGSGHKAVAVPQIRGKRNTRHWMSAIGYTCVNVEEQAHGS